MTQIKAVPPLAPSFARLFLALGLGLGIVTVVLAFAVEAPVLAMLLTGPLVLAFVGLVTHEVGRLLDDEAGAA